MVKRAKGTVTVFGGSGFVGRYIVEHLADAGWTIRVAVRHPSNAQFLKPLGDVGQITPIACSVTDEEQVKAAVEGADAVFSLVGILYESGNQTFEAVHVEAAERIARLSKAAGVKRLVHLSAIGADKTAEADYARSKAFGEEAVLKAFPEAAILRPSVIFGPEDDFFNRFAGLARFAPALPLIGGGKTRFQPVYVGDVADAAIAVLEDEGAKGQIYELGGPRIYTFKELMQVMLKTINRRRFLAPLPFEVAMAQAAVLELAPKPLLTRDQVRLLKKDNVVSSKAKSFADLNIKPHSVEVVIPTYLDRHRTGGRYTQTPHPLERG
jgi:NADH dehydrogenase